MSRRRLSAVIGGLAAVATAAALITGLPVTSASAATGGTGTGYLHTSGNKIVDSTGATVRLTGINWFGMETDNKTFHGLWASQPWTQMIDHMAQLGYNTVRIPFSDDALKSNAVATSINSNTNPDLVGLSPLQVLDKVIGYMGSKGMRVLLDRHRPTSAAQTPLWYTSAVPESTWISDWKMLAQHYAGNTTVIGADLHNEPHAEGTKPNSTGACWGCGDTARDWRLAAERAGNAILGVQPNWLIVVEGTSCPSGGENNVYDNDTTNDEDCGWWGGNLSKAGDYPVQLSVANRLVYSPHEYATSVYHQKWFDDPSFPANMTAIWDHYWGYLYKQNIAPILVGEFGTTLQASVDKTWLTSLMAYMGTGVNGMSFTYWSWNPDSGDTGGIVLDDWVTVNQAKQDILQPYLIGPVSGGNTGGPTGSTSSPTTQVSPSKSVSPSVSPSKSVSPSVSPSKPPSSPPVSTTGSCTATYKQDSSWQGGFQGSLTVKNMTATSINPWNVTWTWPSGVTLGSGWNATVTQSGTSVTAAAPSWAPSLAAGASVTIGFTANGSASAPASVKLGSSACV